MGLLGILVLLAAVLSPQFAFAHGDEGAPRYVSEIGEDIGDCTLPIRPCRTIGYAQGVVGKGGEIRVAGGSYELHDTGTIFNLISGLVEVNGGYSRFDHFQTASPDIHKTTLVGVPLEYRDALRARGFHVIRDLKGVDRGRRARLAELHRTFAAINQSRGRADCVNNRADIHACENIDLISRIAVQDFGPEPFALNDIWGFVDLNTEREYALVGLSNGASVVDVTDPEAPFEVGYVLGANTDWRDLKVLQTFDAERDRWNAYAYVSADTAAHLLVMDLTELPNRVSLGHRLVDWGIHNVYMSNVDYATGTPTGDAPPLLQALGTQQAQGRFLSYHLDDPLNPTLIAESTSEYSHDATSMRVRDERASQCAAPGGSCEVLFDFNEQTLDLWDFSNQASPTMLSSVSYARAAYVHSGWWSEDGRYVFVQDELDELKHGINTTLRVFGLSDLRNPIEIGVWTGPTEAIDHNGFVRGNRYYMSNYTRGLTVLDITDPRRPREVGFFDTFPISDGPGFNAAWGVFPFLPSGNLVVSDLDTGLYVLEDHTRQSPAGKLAFSAPYYGGVEGQTLEISVQRTASTDGPVEVDYQVHGASADRTDLVLTNGTLSWPNGDASPRSVHIPLTRDAESEPMERALLRISNPRGGAVLGRVNTASVFIGDAGAAPGVTIAEPRLVVEESRERAIVTVKRVGSPVGAVSAFVDLIPGTALAGSDYVAPVERRLRWEHGDGRARSLVIDLIADSVEESAERFRVRLQSVTGANVVVGEADIEIGDDSGPAVTDIMLYDNILNQDKRVMRDGIQLSGESIQPSRLNFRVRVRDEKAVGSVRFELLGPVSFERILAARDGGLLLQGTDQGAMSLVDGRYQLTATPYSEADLAGTQGAAKRVSFVVGDAPKRSSTDARLESLALSGVFFQFDSDIEDYATVYDGLVPFVTVSAKPSHAGASVEVAPADSLGLLDGHQVFLNSETNNIRVIVTAEDGLTTRTYRVRVERRIAFPIF